MPVEWKEKEKSSVRKRRRGWCWRVLTEQFRYLNWSAPLNYGHFFLLQMRHFLSASFSSPLFLSFYHGSSSSSSGDSQRTSSNVDVSNLYPAGTPAYGKDHLCRLMCPFRWMTSTYRILTATISLSWTHLFSRTIRVPLRLIWYMPNRTRLCENYLEDFTKSDNNKMYSWARSIAIHERVLRLGNWQEAISPTARYDRRLH